MGSSVLTPRTAVMAGVVALAVAGLAGCASPEDDKKPEHRSFALQGRTLTVDAEDSALDVVAVDGGPDDRVEVTQWFTGKVVIGDGPDVSWSMTGDRLKLRVNCSGFMADCAARHRIEVPRGIAVRIQNEDGSVEASGFRAALSVHTGDGSVRVSDSTGPLDLSTGDGSIRADVDARRIKAETGDGSIHLELGAVPDLVDTRTGDGSVHVEVPRATYRVTTRTGDGSIDVDVPRDESSKHVLSARTGDGRIRVSTLN
ncbi:DUF4097 family beta strand repeat-containing protein [Streptomyces sp. NPDC006458]|uniref:DUF4097 family beta strand repeat-containing protein n=1 Tax=Streptomyces sp. NPDC006458 TaxID=3154302 RepID=UPI0033B60995